MLAPFLAALKLELDRGLAAPARLWLTTTLQQAARAALRAALVGLALLVGSGFLLAAAQMGLARLIGPALAATAIGAALLCAAALGLILASRKAPAPSPAAATAPIQINVPVTAPVPPSTALAPAPGPTLGAEYIGFLAAFVLTRALLRQRKPRR
jgi:hypothetical protein